jgi:predicted nucleic acid-binding protein
VILVDTSAWIDFFNGQGSPEAELLARFIEKGDDVVTCGVVLAEFFQGLRKPASVRRLEVYFLEMRCLAPHEPATYLAAAALFRNLRAKGFTIRSTIDCLVATIAAEHGARVLSKDRDIRTILQSGLCAAKPAS